MIVGPPQMDRMCSRGSVSLSVSETVSYTVFLYTLHIHVISLIEADADTRIRHCTHVIL